MSLQFRYHDHHATANASGTQHFFHTWIPGLLLSVFLLSGCSGAPQSKDEVNNIRAESQTQPAKPNVSSEAAPLKPKSDQPKVLAKQNQQEFKPRVEPDLKPPSPTKKAAPVTPAAMHSENQTTSQVTNQLTNQTTGSTRQTTQRPVFQRWPSEAEKKKLKANALDIFTKKLQAICFEKANKDGLSYLADKRSGYELMAPVSDAKAKPVATIVSEQLRYDRSGIGSLTLKVSVECPNVKVRSKPARFSKIIPQKKFAFRGELPKVAEADFPALLPWSEPADFPKMRFTVTYRQGVEIEKAQIYGGSWLESLRFLNQKEQIKMLNLDQSKILSPAGSKLYKAFHARLPMMWEEQKDRLVILQQFMFPIVAGKSFAGLARTTEQGIAPALRTWEYHECEGNFEITEMPLGRYQVWMSEDEVTKTDKLNGVEFRGHLFVVVRGYERPRKVRVWKWSGWEKSKVKAAAEWGDWVEPSTRVAVLKVKVADGKVEWTPVQNETLSYTVKFDLKDWCLTKAEKERLLSVLKFSDKKLREEPKWKALPFETPKKRLN